MPLPSSLRHSRPRRGLPPLARPAASTPPRAVTVQAERLRAAHAERLAGYASLLRFYEGRHWDHEPGFAGGRTRLTLNYARAIVDKGVSYLLGRGVNVSVPGDPAAEAFLYRVAAENDLAAVDLHAATNAAVLGDAVFKVAWDTATGRVRVANVDPLAFFPSRAADDPTRLREAALVYDLAGDDAAATFGPSFAGRERCTVVERWLPDHLTVLVDDRPAHDGPNPYAPYVPFVHVPNLPGPNAAWGTSDLRDVIPLNREINARLSDQAESIRYHADPPVVFRGVQEHTDLAVGAGTVWDLPQEADVSLLEWRGHPPAVQAHVELLFRALYEVAETPRTSFGDSGRLLSGVALETELRPLIMRTLRKRVFWEAALRRRNSLALAIAGLAGVGPRGWADTPPATRIVWPPLVPRDDAQEIRGNIDLVQAGLRSRLAALDALGVESPEAELEQMQREAAEAADVAAAEATARGRQP